MTKRILAICFALFILLSVAVVPVFAESSQDGMVVDSASLLSAAEKSDLEAACKDAAAKCQCNIVVLTVNDLNGASFSHNGTTQDYADVYYETVYGKNTDGILIMVVLSNENGRRETYFSTSGKCIKRLSDSEREDILDDLQYHHHPDTAGYYDMLNAAVKDLTEVVPPHVAWYKLPLAFLIGFVIAIIIMLILKSQLKSVSMQHGAANYTRMGSMNVTSSRDTYLYSTVSKTARPKESSSSHTSSGGGTHGGGGREF